MVIFILLANREITIALIMKLKKTEENAEKQVKVIQANSEKLAKKIQEN